MRAELIEYTKRVCNKLTPEQLDDAVSQYDNLLVLRDKVMEGHEVGTEHAPGLDAHMHEFLHDLMAIGQDPTMSFQSQVIELRNILTEAFWFGYEAGKMQWPIPIKTCEEAHT